VRKLNPISENLDESGIPVEESLLLEMANAIQKYTGLPGVIYFCTKEEVSNPQAKALGRVKWLNAGEETFISIKADKDGRRKCGGDKRSVATLERFVIANEDLLWTYWNTPKDQADSASTMRAFAKLT